MQMGMGQLQEEQQEAARPPRGRRAARLDASPPSSKLAWDNKRSLEHLTVHRSKHALAHWRAWFWHALHSLGVGSEGETLRCCGHVAGCSLFCSVAAACLACRECRA